mgnify:CR=1 FL=1
MTTQNTTVTRVSTEMGKHGLYPRLINLSGVVLPFIGFAIAIWFVWGAWLDWVQVAVLVVMYLITGLGITIGYHRLFTHRSFVTPRWVSTAFAIMGSMAVEGPVMHWVAIHRKHHQYSDHEDDPHSPHTHGAGLINAIRGMWHAHVGWVTEQRKHMDLPNYVYDLKKDKMLVWVSKLFFVWVALGLLIPAVAGGLLTMLLLDGSFWKGALLGFLWGGLARIVLVHHVTWSINSVCHIWGGTPFKSNDESKNNVIFGVLAMGEGWHNNHHAFPRSARHGLFWWQFDLSYVIIKAMSWVGLAKKINVPDQKTMDSRRLVEK